MKLDIIANGGGFMNIIKVKINNFKTLKNFEFEPYNGMNILVGNNNEGKSTILEAIHLALTGFYRGIYIRNSFTQDIFNEECVNEYISQININNSTPLPKLNIEIFFDDAPELLGTNNSEQIDIATINFSIEFDNNYEKEYKTFVEKGNITTLPIEYYKVLWHCSSNDDNEMTTRSIPIKSVLIDTSDSNLRNSSDTCISKIIKEKLEEEEIIDISQTYRNVRDQFINSQTIVDINNRLSEEDHLMGNKIQMDVEMLNKNQWEKAIITKINSTPFENVGKGEQSTLKIELSLKNPKAEKAGIILLEEPENHLTYSKLNRLLNDVEKVSGNKQIFITTHSSFVANKLGLKKLILLENQKTMKFNDLSEDTQEFFMKKPGYDTLRFLLCSKAILVEGDAGELIVQRAYKDEYDKLPIEDEIDVISVGTTFLRFLEIADKLKKETIILTDNDGDISALEGKYDDYIGENSKEYIKIYYDKETHKFQGELKAKNGGDFNYDTLEPCILRANSLKLINEILDKNCSSDDELIKYMVANKTDCAIKIFKSEISINYPDYIKKAIGNYEK
mgnify:CR=1 FL=1